MPPRGTGRIIISDPTKNGQSGGGAVGTHKAKGPEVVQAVQWALQAGYRHIGTTPRVVLAATMA